MKNPLFVLMVLTCGWAFGLAVVPVVFAEEATSLQVAPSDQIVYPDASQVLNKTPAAKDTTVTGSVAPVVATNKPLVASTPVLASATATVERAKAADTHGWYLRWSFADSEASVRAWAAALGRPVTVNALADGKWEVVQGPLDATTIKTALEGQFGKASLVRR